MMCPDTIPKVSLAQWLQQNGVGSFEAPSTNQTSWKWRGSKWILDLKDLVNLNKIPKKDTRSFEFITTEL